MITRGFSMSWKMSERLSKLLDEAEEFDAFQGEDCNRSVFKMRLLIEIEEKLKPFVPKEQIKEAADTMYNLIMEIELP